MKLTVAILALNEELMIARAIASSRFADEVLVIDGGSTDKTVKLSEQAGARVIERPFDDFARQRNFAIEQAVGEWILFVDADERVTPALASEVRSLLAGAPAEDAFAVPRRSMALGHWFTWHVGGTDAPVRLLKRGGPRWSGAVHEVVDGASSTGTLKGELLHLTHRSVSDLMQKIDQYSEFQAASRLEKGLRAPSPKELFGSFERALKDLRRSGLDDEGDAGAVEAVLLAFNETLVLAKMWEQSLPEPLAETYARTDDELDLPEPR